MFMAATSPYRPRHALSIRRVRLARGSAPSWRGAGTTPGRHSGSGWTVSGTGSMGTPWPIGWHGMARAISSALSGHPMSSSSGWRGTTKRWSAEESRLVDPEALRALRGGIGESYRASLQHILASAPDGLSFAELVAALRARQGHEVARNTVRTLLHAGGFLQRGGRWVRVARSRWERPAIAQEPRCPSGWHQRRGQAPP